MDKTELMNHIRLMSLSMLLVGISAGLWLAGKIPADFGWGIFLAGSLLGYVSMSKYQSQFVALVESLK